MSFWDFNVFQMFWLEEWWVLVVLFDELRVFGDLVLCLEAIGYFEWILVCPVNCKFNCVLINVMFSKINFYGEVHYRGDILNLWERLLEMKFCIGCEVIWQLKSEFFFSVLTWRLLGLKTTEYKKVKLTDRVV